MDEDRCCKKIYLAKSMGNRPRGRPPLRWIDCVEKDLNIFKVKNWRTVTKSRDAWRRPGPTKGCRAIEESRFQLCPDDNHICVWRHPEQRGDSSLTILCHTGFHQGVMSGMPSALIAGCLWLSFLAH
ncbi:hypothetical protein TNCV_1799641 [Trichonephila clavipes]|nr:hypothetical protein TNCV_1799641 [Trichonephila clavipes]